MRASFKKRLGVGAGGIKSMVPIELKTQIKSGSALFCFPHQRNLRPQSNSLPWGHIMPGFSTSQKTSWPNSTGSPRLATTPNSGLEDWSLSSLSQDPAVLFLLSRQKTSFPGSLGKHPVPSFSSCQCALRGSVTSQNGCVTKPRTLGERGASHQLFSMAPQQNSTKLGVSFPFPCTPLTTF